LPHEEILKVANPYLGKCLTLAEDWTPLGQVQTAFAKYAPQPHDPADPWQFKNFLLVEGT
jgi:homospermidine synthase